MIFEEEEPRGLLGVIQLGGAAGLFSEDVVDVLEGLFKQTKRARAAGTGRSAARALW
jgi:hypothetical protein